MLGTIYEKAVHYWPLLSSSSLGDAITCQDALNVYSTPATVTSVDGLYGISIPGEAGVQLNTSSQDHGCLKSFSSCSEGKFEGIPSYISQKSKISRQEIEKNCCFMKNKNFNNKIGIGY